MNFGPPPQLFYRMAPAGWLRGGKIHGSWRIFAFWFVLPNFHKGRTACDGGTEITNPPFYLGVDSSAHREGFDVAHKGHPRSPSGAKGPMMTSPWRDYNWKGESANLISQLFIRLLFDDIFISLEELELSGHLLFSLMGGYPPHG